MHRDTYVRLYVYIHIHIFRQIKCLDMYIFLYYRYGHVYRCICLGIYTHMWDVCMCEKKERKTDGERRKCVYVHVCVCTHPTF